MQHADIVRVVVQGRLGLGCTTWASWNKANLNEWQCMVQKEVHKVQEETRHISA